jgi:2-(1,2-epoxy-1,2-dihydrophenyl)acetyl-CoA isomerase
MGNPVNLVIQHGLATIRLARPEAGNAMDWALVDAFSAACAAIAVDPSVRAVLIEAEGRNFCVGGDLRVFASETDQAGFLGRLARRLHEGVETLAALPAPVIVAVQGAAAGAGLSLVAGGDLVIAGRSTHYSMAYTAIGLVADGGATWLLPRVIGLRLAQEMAYTNRRLSADEALACGLVTRLVDDEVAADEARTLAAKIASGPTFAYGQVKRLFGATFAADLPTQLEAEATAIGKAMATEDAKGALAAFFGRRAPAFSGR